jgi:hypothetical protein
MHTKRHPWGEIRKRCYAHVYYNAHIAAAAVDEFTEELLGYKAELEQGLSINGHEAAYKTFFTVKGTPVPNGNLQQRSDPTAPEPVRRVLYSSDQRYQGSR